MRVDRVLLISCISMLIVFGSGMLLPFTKTTSDPALIEDSTNPADDNKVRDDNGKADIIVLRDRIAEIFRARIAKNEGAAVGALRSISAAMQQYQNGEIAGDKSGEYGLFNELAGVTVDDSNSAKPGFVSAAFGSKTSTKSGYNFQIMLPGAQHAEGWFDNALATNDNHTWTAYAWPVNTGTTGVRSFYVDQQGKVVEMDTQEGWFALTQK